MPIVDEKAPRECDFDALVTELRDVDANTACVFNCQVGQRIKYIGFQLRDTVGLDVVTVQKDINQTFKLLNLWRFCFNNLYAET